MSDVFSREMRVTSTEVPSQVSGLPDDAHRVLIDCWRVWSKHLHKNLKLSVYYDGHRTLKDLGISIPPQMAGINAALGWPAKAVTALARKHVFEGFALSGQTDAFDATGLLTQNAFDVELSQAITSAYKHSCSFLTTTLGDPTAGDPEVVIQAREATMSAALWDQRRREMSAFMTVDSTDKEGRPDGIVLYTRAETWRLEHSNYRWTATPMGNTSGRLLVQPIIYDPQIGRPFGRSRITREVRYLTDAAIRTLVRSEVSAEFFATPQRYAIGVDEGAFAGADKWSAIMGRLLALTPNENGDNPTVGQFAQMSMSPHLEMYRQLAQNFCSATNLPTSSVGIFAENPTSAEAMQAAEAALADEAEYQWRIFSAPLRGLLGDLLVLRDEEPVPDELWDVDVRWTPARYASPAASADFAVKMVQAFPDLATSTVLMRRAGLTEADLLAIEAERRRANAGSILNKLNAPAQAESETASAAQGKEPPHTPGRASLT